MAKVPWSSDSWVKIILIVSLALSMGGVVAAIMYRAVFGTDVDSNIIPNIFEQFIALFGVVVGYVLGSRKDGP